MIGHYLSSNNKICYSTKTQTFSRTKHSLTTCYYQNVDHSPTVNSKMPENRIPIAVVIFDVVKMITFGQDFSLSICVRSALTTWSCTRKEYSVNISQEIIHGKKKMMKTYSNGVWRFGARYGSLSGSSKAFNFIYNIRIIYMIESQI